MSLSQVLLSNDVQHIQQLSYRFKNHGFLNHDYRPMKHQVINDHQPMKFAFILCSNN